MNDIILDFQIAKINNLYTLAPYFSRAEDEVRALTQAITHLSIDMMPDYANSELNIILYPLAKLFYFRNLYFNELWVNNKIFTLDVHVYPDALKPSPVNALKFSKSPFATKATISQNRFAIV